MTRQSNDMLSVLLYGRNDDHGYNLHKRVVVSLNCIAELLSEETDEIIFVDYNSPDDLPTLPEAIHDTLTAKARSRLRILRVRPDVHARFKDRTRLPVLEAIARNIAVRRSNPANRWVLSTNGDMIFVPQAGSSLSAIARDLPSGLYHIPRFDLPEALWETFNRLDAPGTIESVRHWGAAAHLNEIVHCDFVRYDCPGDFQLMLRSDLWRIGGFNEQLIHGWHLDYNIAKRLSFVHGGVSDLADKIVGYHCDHTRRSTPTHEPDHQANSWYLSFESVARADLPEQAETWGCPNDALEELRLTETATSPYLTALRTSLSSSMPGSSHVARGSTSDDRGLSQPRHILPFLASYLAPAPRRWVAAWIGEDLELFELFRKAWAALGFHSPIFIPRELEKCLVTGPSSAVSIGDAAEILKTANVLLFDFARPKASDMLDDGAANFVENSFIQAVEIERRRAADAQAARPFVCANAIDNRYEQMVLGLLAAVHTPFSTRVRYGFVRPAGGQIGDWLARMDVGPAGYRDMGTIRTRARGAGAAAYGPRVWLPSGSYSASVDITIGKFGGVRSLVRLLWQLGRVAHFYIATGGRVLAKRSTFFVGPRKRSIKFSFSVTPASSDTAGVRDLEAWVLTSGICDLAISRLKIDPLGEVRDGGRI
jgi:hypothetical protein